MIASGCLCAILHIRQILRQSQFCFRQFFAEISGMTQFADPAILNDRQIYRARVRAFDVSQQGVVVCIMLDTNYFFITPWGDDKIPCGVENNRIPRFGYLNCRYRFDRQSRRLGRA